MLSKLSEKLSRPKLQFPQLPDAAPDSMLITNTKGEIYYVNPAWEKMTGYKFGEIKGKNPRFLQSGKTPKKFYKKLWKTLLEGKPLITDEVIDRKKNGTEYQTQSTFFPIRKEGKNIFYVQMQHDVTKQKLLEKQRVELFSLASHELKTPIATLKLISELVLKKLKKGETVLSYILMLNKELDRLTILIAEMLDISKLEVGKMKLNLEKVNLLAMVCEVVKKMLVLADKRKLVFKSETKNKIMIRADKVRIEQVLINLLTNAIKYSENKTVITVKIILTTKDWVTVSVTDQGRAINKNKLAKIFNRYYQSNNKNEGFGLGLYISKNIIHKHEGKIWAKSKAGKGSTFYFSLPLLKD